MANNNTIRPKRNRFRNTHTFFFKSMTDNEMYSMFITCGPLVSAKIMRDKATGYSFGYGFVQFQVSCTWQDTASDTDSYSFRSVALDRIQLWIRIRTVSGQLLHLILVRNNLWSQPRLLPASVILSKLTDYMFQITGLPAVRRTQPITIGQNFFKHPCPIATMVTW